MKTPRALVALTAAASLAAGCGNPVPKSYESMRMPAGAKDLGEAVVGIGGAFYDAHSFLVVSRHVGEASCGAVVLDDGSRLNSYRKLTPAGDTHTQVDCIYPDQTNSFISVDELAKFASMPVQYTPR